MTVPEVCANSRTVQELNEAPDLINIRAAQITHHEDHGKPFRPSKLDSLNVSLALEVMVKLGRLIGSLTIKHSR